jgi:choline-sulfatase
MKTIEESDAGGIMSTQNRPNILIIMSDEHGAEYSDVYGHPLVQTPSMRRLAAEGMTFDSAYCNVPLCVPSRACFMTGQHNHHNRIWDNGSPFREDAVTWPHLLRRAGYRTALSGKMHLVGMDRLRGFEQQLARDLHSEMQHPIHSWREGLPYSTVPWTGLYEAGIGVPGHEGDNDNVPEDLGSRTNIPSGAGRTLEIDLDDLAEAAALNFLADSDRHDQQWALCVGFIAPHFPFVVPEHFYSMYWPDNVDTPVLPPGHLDTLPQAAQNLRNSFGFSGHTVDQVQRARAAYYGLITYMDDKIGRLLDALDRHSLSENTVVIHTSDHGELLGAHGLWRKMSFYEQSARIPMQIRWPAAVSGGARSDRCVTLTDLTATILEIAGVDTDQQKTRWDIDGNSLLPLLQGLDGDWVDEAFVEFNAHGTDRPRAMLRQGRWKISMTWGRPADTELYNLETDPGEFVNMAGVPEHATVQNELESALTRRWDGERIYNEVLRSQDERILIRGIADDCEF